MPSDTSTSMNANPADAALSALAVAEDEFRSAVATADEEVRTYRAHHETAAADPVAVLRAELGTFAQGRVDARRLAGLLAVADAPDPLTDRLMGEAHTLFDAIMAGGREAFHVVVPPGGDLRDAVRDALAELGRAFGMAHAVEKAREHRYRPDEDHVLLHRYPFHRWSPLERELAPPLVVEVEASDLRAAGLVEFLEGWQKIALVVRGEVEPAPLARLISPQVLVAQAPHGEAAKLLKELAPMHGPGIVGSFDDDSGVLPFVHRPGKALEVDRNALTQAVDRVAGARRQPGLLDLQHLQSLVSLPGPVASKIPAEAGVPEAAGAPATGSTAAPGDSAHLGSVDRLAAWLLSRTDLSGT